MTIQKAKEVIEQATGKEVEIRFVCTDFRQSKGTENIIYKEVQLFTPFQLRTLDESDIAQAVDYVSNH